MIVFNRDRVSGANRKGRVALILAGLLALGAAPPANPDAQAEAAPATDASAPAAGHKLLGVEQRPSTSGVALLLHTDGPVEHPESFALKDPARLVIDLPGVTNAAKASRLDVNASGVKRVRLAQHDGKVRVVVDGSTAALAKPQIVPSAEGVMVLLAGGEATAAASAADSAASPSGEAAPAAAAPAGETAPAASAPATEAASAAAAPAADANAAAPAEAAAPAAAAAEPPAKKKSAKKTSAKAKAKAAASADAPAAAPARVLGVQYDAQADRDRIAIAGEGPLKYHLMRPDPQTLLVSFPGATIDPRAAQKITPDPGRAVSLITAFDQPGSKTPEVRVVIQRAAGLEPTVTKDGSVLVLDFARGDKVAATPPILGGPAAVPAVAEGSTPASKTLAAAHPASRARGKAPAAGESGGSASILEEGGLMAGKAYTGRRISLDFKDVDINDVLRLIAEVSDLNVIAGDDVKGKVTIRLVDVPWDQALDVILLTKGLGFVRVGNVLRIAPAELLKQEEEARLQEKRAKEKLEDLQVRLIPVNYANVTEVEKMAKRLLTQRGTVNVDKRTNTVIIKDIPQVLNEAESLIRSIDTQTPQVLIEAKIVEANLDFSRELGTQWAFGSNPPIDGGGANDHDWVIGGITPKTATSTTWPAQGPNNVVIDNPIKAVPTGVLNLSGFLLDDRLSFQLRLAAAESDGETKTISSPRVVTLDNREAKIEQGVSIPFQTFENGDAKLEFIDAVLSLLVTPHITQDKSIIMKIEVKRDAPTDVPNPTGSPSIAKNQAKTETLVKDGQTLVLGGIYVIDKSDTQSRTPYLHKIPILGNAFKSDRASDSRKELLIFVTPQIVHGMATTASTN